MSLTDKTEIEVKWRLSDRSTLSCGSIALLIPNIEERKCKRIRKMMNSNNVQECKRNGAATNFTSAKEGWTQTTSCNIQVLSPKDKRVMRCDRF